MKSTHAAALPPALSTDVLLDTPLPQLLADLGIELSERPAADLPPCGYAVVRGGSVALRMPEGQNRWEREMVARSMIGSALRVPLPELPEPFRLSEMSAAI
jgi:hypothetical protein